MTNRTAEVADLSGIDIEDTLEYAVLAPGSGKKTGWVITLAGPYHEKAVAWANANNQKRIARQAKIEAQQLNSRKIKPEDRTAEDQRDENVSWLGSRIVGWTPVKVPFLNDGEPIEFSDANVKLVFGHVRMGWAFQQLTDVLNDEASFTTRSGKA